MDTIRKTELRKNSRIKRCTRCGAMTEDVLQFRGFGVLVMQFQRQCICGSWFMIGEEEGVGQVGNAGF